MTQLGLWREPGHEHFNGCIVVPFHDEAGHVVSLYGQRAQRGELKHLYPPGPHRGLFNRQCLNQSEIILCEALFDAPAFYAHGSANVTCLFGTEGLTEELGEALRKVIRVRLAYDADEAGERAAQRDAERFRAQGIEVYRVKFSWGMYANEYARKGPADGHQPADQSLGLLLNSAVWLGKGGTGNLPTGTGTARDSTVPALNGERADLPSGESPDGTGKLPVPPWKLARRLSLFNCCC